MVFNKFQIVLLCISLLCSASYAGAENTIEVDSKVSELIPHIAQSELLYRDIEIHYDESYKLGNVGPTDRLYSEFQAKARQVLQGEKFYFSYEHGGSSEGGGTRNESRLIGYDGNVSRAWHQGLIGNIHLNRVEDHSMIRPHSLLRFEQSHAGLSDFLRNGATPVMNTVPDGMDLHQTVKFIGGERLLNENCVVIETVSDYNGEASGERIQFSTKTRMWICPEKNYLPVKTETFETDAAGAERSTGTFEVTELQEISPGVYFPKGYNLKSYRYDEQGAKILRKEHSWKITDIKYLPNYPDTFFSEIEFGPDAIIYIRRDGNIIAERATGKFAKFYSEDDISNIILGTSTDTDQSDLASFGSDDTSNDFDDNGEKFPPEEKDSSFKTWIAITIVFLIVLGAILYLRYRHKPSI